MRYIRITVLSLALLFLLGLSPQALDYISYNGKFYITLPDDWVQIDYNMVDLYLSQSDASEDIYNYDACFADVEAKPFYTGRYFILKVDTSIVYSDKQIDSTLKELKQIFGLDVKYYPIGDLMTNLRSGEPGYDAEAKIISIYNHITDVDQNVKKNLVLMKFYEHGLASFYFYSPDSLFKENIGVFQGIVRSLETENYLDVKQTGEVKVADIENKINREEASDNHTLMIILIVAGLLVAFGVVKLIKR